MGKVMTAKITKGQIDEARASGAQFVKFTNKGVQRRLLKEQEKIRRKQEVRENQTKALNKAKKKAAGTRPVGGGIGLAHPIGDGKVRIIDESAYFIDKDGKRVPVSSEVAEEVTEKFEAAANAEEDLSAAAGPEYRYLQQDEAEAEQIAGVRMVSPFEGMGAVVTIAGEQINVGLTEVKSIDDIPDDIGEREIDSVLAEHSLNPFDQVSPGPRGQMFASHLSSVLKVEETQLFQPGLTDAITEEGCNNVEAMRQGLEDAGLSRDPVVH